MANKKKVSKKTTSQKKVIKKGFVNVSFKTKSGKIVKFSAKKPSKSRIKTRKPYGLR